MSAPVRFDGVWKKFRGGERHDSLRDLIPATVKRLTGRGRRRDELEGEEFWALQDVSFEVPQGTALGIIGPNGAGKSTILKVLTRILRPNRGVSVVSGRVGALIEVAAGFHPDLTGRENVYLQGAVMGMKRHEVDRRFDEIVEFAGVAQFIDTQIKRYSSGMNARLGFSIAAHLQPDVMIIDEVLSVGDMAFQERCIERMRDFKRNGVTIVFVSHNLQAVTELCDRALYLKRRVRSFGPSAEVIDTYVRDAMDSGTASLANTELSILSTRLTYEDGTDVTGPIEPAARLQLAVDCESTAPISDMGIAFRLIRATDQLLVYDGQFPQRELDLNTDVPGRFAITFAFEANLTRGQYYIDLTIGHPTSQRYLARLTPAAHLTVTETRTWGGIANLMATASSVSVQPAIPQAV
jgi:lipopolysaccharide transport system ATP-binding protein